MHGGTEGSRGLSSTKQPPLRESIKSVADQLLVTDEAAVEAQMIQSDVRTPPVVQAHTHFKKKVVIPHHEEDKKKKDNDDTDLVGQGVAVPVIMEEADDIKHAEEMLLPSRGETPKPTAGISTWVLLSGSGNTTPPVPQPSSPSTAVKVNKKSTITVTTAPTVTQTTKKPPRSTTAETKPHTKAPSNASNNKLVHQFRPLLHGSTSNNKVASTSATITTAASVTSITTMSTTPAGPTVTARPNKNKQQNKNDTTLLEDTTAQARRPISSSVQAEGGKPKTTAATTQTPTKLKKTTTIAPVTTTVIVTTAESELDESTATAETTTKRTRRPGSNGTKKRKKNKNKRRKRPTNNNGTEVSDDGETTALTGLEVAVLEAGNVTKTNGNKDKDKHPLSTRIYNYLAREVMPSVGVGLIGLMVTAGLAGLIMYPFGGGLTPAARRTYEEQHTSVSQLPYYRNRFPHQHHQQQTGPFLYYEGAEDPNSGQAEEAVLEQVLDGMGEPSRYDSDIGTDTVVSGFDPQGGFKYPTVSATDSPPYRVQYASTGASVQQSSTTTSTVRPYYRPSTIQRVEATPKYAAAAVAVSPAHHHVGIEKFYGSEAKPNVNLRTGPDQQAAPSRKVFDLNDRQGSAAVDVSYGGGRVRFREIGVVDHQPIQHSSVIAEHGPRSLRKKRELRIDDGKAAASQDFLENAIGTGEKKEGWPMKKTVQEPSKLAEAAVLTTSVIETTTSQEATTFEASTVATITTNTPEEQQQTTTEGKPSDKSMMTTTARLSNDIENITIVGDVATRNISQIAAASINNSNVTDPEVEIIGEGTDDSNSNPPSSSGETFSFMGLVRRIAQVKLNLGLNFLKNTSDAFGKYIENVQKRMSETLSEAADVRYKEAPSTGPEGFWDTVRRIQRHIQRGYRSVINGRRPQHGNDKRE